MKKIWLTAWIGIVFVLLMPATCALAQAQAKAKPRVARGLVNFSNELQVVTTNLKAKFDAGKTNAADLQENLNAINLLILMHLKNGDREQVARLYLLDAHIYADGLGKKDRAQAIWGQIIQEFPGTMAAKGAAISLYKEVENIPVGLEIGERFPDFSETDANGNLLNLSTFRGRVTMIDFWATWCAPCRAEMPNVITTYQRYHSLGFDIIGVSLDDNRNTLAAFTRLEHMPWQQYYDGKGWQNKLATRYKVQAIPMDYLLDRRGVIIGKELRGQELFDAVTKALSSNDDDPLPPSKGFQEQKQPQPLPVVQHGLASPDRKTP